MIDEKTNCTGTVTEEWARDISTDWMEKFGPLGSDGCHVIPLCGIKKDQVEGSEPDFTYVVPKIALILDDSMFDEFGITKTAIEAVDLILESMTRIRNETFEKVSRFKRTVDMEKVNAGDEDAIRYAVSGLVGIVMEGEDTSEIDKIIEMSTKDAIEHIRKGERFF